METKYNEAKSTMEALEVFEMNGQITPEQITELDAARNTFYDLEWQYQEANQFVQQQQRESMKMDYDKRQMHLNKMKEQKAKYDDQVKQATKRMVKFVKDETSLNDLLTKQEAAKGNL